MTGHPHAKRIRQLERAFRKLPPLQRTIFAEVRFDGLSYEEIGVRHGLTAAETEALFAKAFLNFSRHLNGARRRWWHWR